MLTAKVGTRELAASEVVSFKSSCASSGIPLGAAVSRSFTLTCVKDEGDTPAALDGKRVLTYIDGVPRGVWYVTDVSCPADSPVMTLSGQDALGCGLDAGFEDSAAAYPRTVSSLLRTVISAVPGLTLRNADFPGADTVISAQPEWETGITLRKVVSHIAFLAGGLARIDGSGALEIVPLGGGSALSPDNCELTLTGGTAFGFGCLRYLFDGDEAYTRFAVTDQTDDPSNTLTYSGDPLITKARAQAVAKRLTGFAAEGGSCLVYGDAAALPGDTLKINGHALCVTGIRLTADKSGVQTVITSQVPGRHSPAARSLTGVKAFNPDGTINCDAIGSFKSRVLGLDKAYIGSLTADEISVSGLLARVIEAATVRAQSIDAADTSTDTLTALCAEIGRATLRKLSAGTVSTDALMAAAAELIAAKVETLDAASVTADRLAAALAAFTVVAAGTAEFDRATVKHLLAECLSVEDAAGDKVLIRNLSADYASVVNAYVGSLCVKADDGGFYSLIVDPDTGAVTAQAAEVTDTEAAEGKTAAGRTIVETQMNVSDLCAADLKAVSALVSKLDAARIDVDALTARQAWIDHLNTCDLTGNGSIRAQLETADSVARYMTFDAADGLIQRVPGTVYYTQVDGSGFYVRCDRSAGPLCSMNAQDGVRAEALTLGDVRCRRTSAGGWVWQAAE